MRLVNDSSSPDTERQLALQTLVDVGAPHLRSVCEAALESDVLAPIAIDGLARYDDEELTSKVIGRFARLPLEVQQDTVFSLISRPAWAGLFLDQLGESLPTTLLTPLLIRQIRLLGQPELDKKLDDRLGRADETDQGLGEELIALQQKLTPTLLGSGDTGRGRLLFQKNCAACHRLFGEGGSLGPDLTGGGRKSIDYLLVNIVDPSAALADDHRVTVLHLRDGRILSGLVKQQDSMKLVLQSVGNDEVIPTTAILRQQKRAISMMPTGLLDDFSDNELADLFSYLTKP
jgi:putative heme-binding domain-containing protein